MRLKKLTPQRLEAYASPHEHKNASPYAFAFKNFGRNDIKDKYFYWTKLSTLSLSISPSLSPLSLLSIQPFRVHNTSHYNEEGVSS